MQETINKAKNSINKIKESKYSFRIIVTLSILLWTIIIFQLGVFVGFKKASFFFKFSDSYYKNIKGDHKMPLGMRDNDLPRSHGAIGKIIKISLPTIIIEDKDGIEKTILLNNKTIIKRFESVASTSDITTNDFAVIIGSPNNNAEIEAKLIRLLPPIEELPELK